LQRFGQDSRGRSSGGSGNRREREGTFDKPFGAKDGYRKGASIGCGVRGLEAGSIGIPAPIGAELATSGPVWLITRRSAHAAETLSGARPRRSRIVEVGHDNLLEYKELEPNLSAKGCGLNPHPRVCRDREESDIRRIAMQRRSGRLWIALIPVFAAMFVASCGQDSTTGPVIVSLVQVSGTGQSAPVNTVLTTPFVVRVQDQSGGPVGGVTVTWEVTAGGGSVSPTQSVTGADGLASTTLHLGSSAGANTVSASFGSGTPVVFSAIATSVGGPGTASPLVNYSSISAGGRSSCGVTTDNVLFCWGYNGEGQLGIGAASGGAGPVFAYPQPTAAAGSLTFKQTVASLYHACAVTLSGVGYCWGVNIDGRLGTGGFSAPVNTPGQVVTPTSFQSISVGRVHTCGLSFSNRVFCWGYSSDGELGIGKQAPIVDSLGNVTPAPDFTGIPTEADSGGVLGLRYQAVAAGGLHTCAITTPLFGSVAFCWGDNQNGELGNGSIGVSNTYFTPNAVARNDIHFMAITAGYTHTCGLDTSGIPYCWGGNASGQLGTGGGGAAVSLPTAVSGGLSFAAISAGMAHTCGVTTSGVLYCWGSNQFGQLGIGTTSDQSAPTQVTGGLLFRSVSAGDRHTCGVTTTNVAYCWGDNQFGQLGDGTTTRRTAPTKVASQP
jgi:alpha-tubulin suppressor-like RCC1 family protein